MDPPGLPPPLVPRPLTPPAAPAAPPAPPDSVRAVAGPLALLFGLGVAILMSLTFGRQMGDVACAWRVSYSPGGRAFAIWGLIFVWMLASVIEQLMVALDFDHVYAAAAWNNMLAGFSLFLAGFWVIAFGYSRREDRRGGLVVSATFLLAGTWCALGAAVQEFSWRGLDPLRIIAVGVPFSLLAGWMTVATALGLATAWVALRYPPDYRCFRETRSYNMFWAEDPTDASGFASWVPLSLSALTAGAALAVPDPVLPLPVAWAIYHMRGHVKNYIGLAVLAFSVAGALLFAYLEVWMV